MRVTFPAGTPTIPSDRNPLTIAQGGVSALSAGSNLTPFTYTVPANRRFEGSISLGFTVNVALAAGQQISVALNKNAVGNFIELDAFAALAAEISRDVINSNLVMFAGENYKGLASLTGAGAGQAIAYHFLNGIEYDA